VAAKQKALDKEKSKKQGSTELTFSFGATRFGSAIHFEGTHLRQG
jgi:hypothetical protein